MYLRNIDDMKASPAIRDHSSLLQFTCHCGDGGPRHSHYLCQELLRQQQIGAYKFMHPQKPFAGTGLYGVNSIAGNVLLHLSQEELIIFDQDPPENLMRLRLLTQIVSVALRVWRLPSCIVAAAVGQGAEPLRSAAPWPGCGENWAA